MSAGEMAGGEDNGDGLTHIGADGAARMVDVGHKERTQRRAVAEATVHLAPETFARLMAGDVPKGDVWATARIAGIMAAKRTHELIPLCHPLALNGVTVDFSPDADRHTVAIAATVKCTGPTGVEMEALTAASVAALTLYDMLKAVERGITISDIKLSAKSGGKSGDWTRDAL